MLRAGMVSRRSFRLAHPGRPAAVAACGLLLVAGAACARVMTNVAPDQAAEAPTRRVFSEETLAWADVMLSKSVPTLTVEGPPGQVTSPTDPPPRASEIASDAELEHLEEEFVPEIPVSIRLVNVVPPAFEVSASPSAMWIVNTLSTALYESSFGQEIVDRIPVGTYFTYEGGNQDNRYLVKRAHDGALGWLPSRGLAPWTTPPTRADVLGRIGDPEPRSYLYWRWPEMARRMDCVIYFESGWNPRALNRTYNAAGLAQFIPQTWRRTPQGKAGFSPYDPYAAIDAFAWMVQGGGSWGEWEVVYLGLC